LTMQIEMDSIMLASGHWEVDGLHRNQRLQDAAQMHTPQHRDSPGRGHNVPLHAFPQNIHSITHMSPALTPILEPSIGQPYQMEGQHMWEARAMQPFVPQYSMPNAGMHAHVPTSFAYPFNTPSSTSVGRLPTIMSVSDTGVLINASSQQNGPGEDPTCRPQQCFSNASKQVQLTAPKQGTP
jgi:hypothetical protein